MYNIKKFDKVHLTANLTQSRPDRILRALLKKIRHSLSDFRPHFAPELCRRPCAVKLLALVNITPTVGHTSPRVGPFVFCCSFSSNSPESIGLSAKFCLELDRWSHAVRLLAIAFWNKWFKQQLFKQSKV